MPAMSVRVLHVLPHRGGGAERYVEMLERLPGYEHERFALSSGRSPAAGLGSVPFRWPALALKARSADLIHTHGDVASGLTVPLARRLPAVMTTHGLHMLRRATGPARAIMASRLRAAATASRVVICTSENEREQLSTIVRSRDAPKLRVIHNGVDPSAAIGASERAAIRAELGLDDDVALALFVGQLEPRKAPLLAAQAVVRVREAGMRIVLIVAGNGPQARELGALAGDAVKPLGYRHDVRQLLAAADIFVAPAEREGMSFALLEAMAGGLVIVASDGPGNPDALGDAGLLFSSGNEDALVDHLIALADDADLRAELGKKARKRALEQFGSERFLAATADAYRDALKEPAPSAGVASA